MSERIHKAERAKRILEDDLTQHALTSIRAGVQAQLWASAVAGRLEDNPRLQALAWAVDQFERCFLVLIQDGQLEQAELLMQANAAVKLNEANERMKRLVGG